MNTYIRKIKKNSKALSPVVASIILIAVTVAVSVVVAAWMGGMTIGLMGNAEQAQVTNVVLTNDATNGAQAVVTIRNTGAATVAISSQTIDGKTATVSAATGQSGTWVAGTDDVQIAKGTTVSITMAVPSGLTFADGAQYVVKLLTAKGTTVTYTATYSSQ